jgi:hypothetical protein
MGGHDSGGRVTVPHDVPSGRLNQKNPYAPVSFFAPLSLARL